MLNEDLWALGERVVLVEKPCGCEGWAEPLMLTEYPWTGGSTWASWQFGMDECYDHEHIDHVQATIMLMRMIEREPQTTPEAWLASLLDR